jgi:hypothetical protein
VDEVLEGRRRVEDGRIPAHEAVLVDVLPMPEDLLHGLLLEDTFPAGEAARQPAGHGLRGQQPDRVTVGVVGPTRY